MIANLSQTKILDSRDQRTVTSPFLEVKDLSIRYGDKLAIDKISLEIPKHSVTAFIGPSGCGKSTFLRSFNRMNDFIPEVILSGNVLFNKVDIYSNKVDASQVRRRIGMVFQKPNPFPKSIFNNIAWGPTINGHKGFLNDLVESTLRKAALWDEVKDRLNENALNLSGGQQQRLCIARALALQPEILLMDEPCSALDPISTSRIEDLIFKLKENHTILIVTHNMQQAARVSDYTAFLESGKLIEFGVTDQIYTKPTNKKTEDYISGKFG